MIELTYEQALRGLKRAVLHRGGDHRFTPDGPDNESESYFYFEGAQPGCIVGHVLSYYGVTESDLGDHNRGFAVDALIGRGILKVNDDTAVLLIHAQSAQDEGERWGDAVACAEQAVDERAATLSDDGADASA